MMRDLPRRVRTIRLVLIRREYHAPREYRRREGRCVYYRVETRGMKPLIDWFAHYRAFRTEHVKRLEQLLEKMDE